MKGGVRAEKKKIGVDNGFDAGRACGSGGSSCDDGAAPRKRRRNSTPGREITASSAGTEDMPSSDAAVAAAEEEGDGNGIIPSGAVMTTPVSCERKTAGGGSTDGHSRSDARGKDDTECVGHPSRGIPSSSLTSKKCSKKRARTPTRAAAKTIAAAAAAAADGDEGASSSSPATMTHPTESTGSVHLSMSLSGEAGSSPSEAHGFDETDNEHAVRPTPRMSPEKGQPTLVPCVVPELTADGDERNDDSQGSAPRKTSRRRGGSATAENVTPNRSRSAAPVCLKSDSPSSGESGHARSTTMARVTTLDFTGRPSWEVSSVVVTTRGNGTSSGTSRSGAATVAATASIVVCHSGGVSVWDLTDAEAVCTYVSPALAGVTKEVVTGSFLAVAVVGGDPTEVTPSARRAPGSNEACIVAIGRHSTDPGLPIIRVWQQQQQQQQRQQGSSSPLLPLPPQDTGRFGGCNGSSSAAAAALENFITTPPAILTISLKKKFSKFFPPVVPSHVAPCLCVCGYEPPAAAAVTVNALEKTGGVEDGATGKQSGAGTGARNDGVITAVIALGSKVLRLVFGVGQRDSQVFSAKTLPASVAAEGERVAY